MRIGIPETSVEETFPRTYNYSSSKLIRVPNKKFLGETQIEIYDLMGKLIDSFNMNLSAETLELDIEKYTPGTYSLIIKNGKDFEGLLFMKE